MDENNNQPPDFKDSHVPEIIFILGSIIISVGFLIFVTSSHWAWMYVLGCIILGLGLIIFSHFKAKVIKGYDKGMKKALAVGISIILLSLIFSTIYAEKFDVTYSISLSLNPNKNGDYRVILPIPSDHSGDPKFISKYSNEKMKIIETEYGKGLEINSSGDFSFFFKGRSGEIQLRDFSLGKDYQNYYYQECFIFMSSEVIDMSIKISIEYDNDGTDAGFDGSINCVLKENGWNITNYQIGGWLS